MSGIDEQTEYINCPQCARRKLIGYWELDDIDNRVLIFIDRLMEPVTCRKTHKTIRCHVAIDLYNTTRNISSNASVNDILSFVEKVKCPSNHAFLRGSVVYNSVIRYARNSACIEGVRYE